MDAGTALLECTLAVDAWDLYMPFAARMPEGLGWIYGSEPVDRTVRAGAGATAAVSRGGRWAGFWRLRARPISCFCDWGAPGFAVKDGAVRAPGGRKWGPRRRRETAEGVRRAYAESNPAGAGDGPYAHDFRESIPFDGAATKPPADRGRGKGGPSAGAAGGGLYAIKMGDA